MNSKICAIDPGCSGGIAWTDGLEADAVKMPETLGDLVDRLRSLSAAGYTTCYLEQVVSYIPKASQSNMFVFGQSFGQIQGCLMALGFRVVEVRPQRWQKELSAGAKAGHGKKWKGHLKGMAQKLFPHLKVTLPMADALLILEWGSKQ
jgi:hypothetical protein